MAGVILSGMPTPTSSSTPGFAPVQAFMKDQRIDGWLVYDFRGSNAVFARLLPHPGPKPRHTTRRAFLYIPANGSPRLAVSVLDANQYQNTGVEVDIYAGWTELQAWLQSTLTGPIGGSRVAMEYAPGGQLPIMGIVDAGTIELVRSMGVEVCSSSDLVQVSIARWGADAVAKHAIASTKVNAIKDEAFALIGKKLRENTPVFEHEVAKFIQERFVADGLEYPDGPIVGVNAHAGDPHYEPSAAHPTQIKKGDWVLIDLWARIPGDQNIYSDVTWVGFAGPSVPAHISKVWEAVKGARNAALKAAQDAWKAGRRVQGWQLDQAARDVLIGSGNGAFIRHRTGHSLSPGKMVHGMGMNLDNFETRDTRLMLPDLGFTIEPGLYLPEFGIRSEINVYVDPTKGPIVTSGVQDTPILIA